MITPFSKRLAAALAGASLLGSALLGCSSGDAGNTAGADTAKAAGPAQIPGIVVGIPVDPAEVAKVVNPKGEAPYSGPTGTLRGTIRITGDAPPDLAVKYPETDCRGEAIAVHGKLFRVGQDNALADALVAVTGYKGYLPPKGEAAKITIHRCALARRTLAAMFGQRIEVANLDQVDSYMPYLDGATTSAILVAIPRGDAVRLYPPQAGHYMLRDQLPNDHMTADVYVLAYPTTDVTGLDGKYEITGIPVGPVDVNAMLPATKKTSHQRVEIKAGDNTLDLTLTFDAAKDDPAKKPKPADAKPADEKPADEKAAGAGSSAAPQKDAKPPGPKG